MNTEKVKLPIGMNLIRLFYFLNIIIYVFLFILMRRHVPVGLQSIVAIGLWVLLIKIITKRYVWGWSVIIGASIFYIFCYGYMLLVLFDLMRPIELPFLESIVSLLSSPIYVVAMLAIPFISRLGVVMPIGIQIAVLVYIVRNKTYFDK